MESCARNNQKRKGVGRKDTWRLLSPSKGTKEGIRDKKRKVTLGRFYGINDVVPVPRSRQVIQTPSLPAYPVLEIHMSSSFLPCFFHAGLETDNNGEGGGIGSEMQDRKKWRTKLPP